MLYPEHDKFYKRNKDFMEDTNISFSCDSENYENHRVYFCVCCHCFDDLKLGKNVDSLNNRWLKFCSSEDNLNLTTFYGSMRFFRYRELISQSPLY